MATKTCTRCKHEKSIDLFRKVKGYKDGHHTWCKACEAEVLKEWRVNNPEKKQKQTERSLAKRKAAGWVDAKRYRERHPYQKKGRYLRTPEQKIIEDREAKKQWKKNNPQQVRAHCSKRRALIKGAKEVEKIIPTEVFERDKGICGICKKPIDGKYEIDHIIPLSKGGTHTYNNVQAAHQYCNRVKHNHIEFNLIPDK